MLNAIVHYSLRFRGILIALTCMALLVAFVRLGKLQYDVFPDFAPPQSTIQVEAPGLSPEQVELLITQPIENAIHGIPGVASIRSQSSQGIAVIPVVFDYGTDPYRDRQLVAERLSSVTSQLPVGIKPPTIAPLTSATSVVLVLGLTSPTQSLMTLRSIADWTIRPKLLAVPGVANTVVFGGDVRQVQIQVQPQKLMQYGLSINDVLQATSKASGIRGGGFIDTDNQRLVLQTDGQFLTPDAIGRTVIMSVNSVPVTLSQVATVVDGPMPPFSAASIMGIPGVLLEVSNQYGANVLDVTHRVEAALEELKPTLKSQGITLHPQLFRPANLIDTANANIHTSLLIGAGLVMLVLFLFLFNFKTAAISCAAIPLSLLASISIMQLLGLSMNTMTLGGLAIAIGEVVDDAVIDVENILRRLRENRLRDEPLPVIQVILNASLEVRTAVVYATFAVALLFLPVLTLSGVAGRLFHPLGVAYLLSIMASLGVALTVTPALCCLLLGHGELSHTEPPFARWLKQRYETLLQPLLIHHQRVGWGVVALTLMGLGSFLLVHTVFLPDLKEGHFIAHTSLMPGTSLAESLRFGNRVTQQLLAIPSVRSCSQRVGRAETSEDTWGTHYSEFDIDLKPLNAQQTEAADTAIRKVFSQYSFASSDIMSYLSEHIMDTISGHKAAVIVSVFGNQLVALDSAAQAITQGIQRLPHAQEVQFRTAPSSPQVSIQLNSDALQRWGMASTDVLDAIRTAYQGTVVSQIADGNQYFGVSVILDPQWRHQVGAIGQLPLRNAAGTFVPLSQLATITESAGRNEITHEGGRRVQVITANVGDGNVNAFVKQIKTLLATKITLPTGTYVEISGTQEAEQQSFQELLFYMALSAIGIVILLLLVMGTPQNVLLVLMNIPFALVGGVLAIVLMGGTLSLGAMVGFITLFGITIRNSIMLMSHYEHLVTIDGHAWNKDTVMLGASERLLPILMTALVTGLGLLPMAMGSGAPGHEIEGPLATVILGGLLSSTLLNLIVLPILAHRFARFKDRELS